MDQGNFGISRVTNNPYGYKLEFCYSCTIKPKSLTPDVKFEYDGLIVSQLALNCSNSLNKTEIQDPDPIEYEKHKSKKILIESYE